MKLKFKSISKLLAVGILINSVNVNSSAKMLTQDGRYETFVGDTLIIDNILEDEKAGVKIEGNTLVVNNQGKEVQPGVEGAVLNSSFENNFVTQEMIDSGEEKSENLGKYKVEVKSTGKNLFDLNTMVTANLGITGSGIIGNYNWGLAKVPVKQNTQYSLKTIESGSAFEHLYYTGPNAGAIGFLDSNGDVIEYLSFGTNLEQVNTGLNGINVLLWDYAYNGDINSNTLDWVTFTTPPNCAYVVFNSTIRNNQDKIQLEEGSVINDYYQAYKGSIRTFYLNSPLLEGDSIELIDGKVNHVHRSKEMVLDGSDDEKYNIHYQSNQDFSIAIPDTTLEYNLTDSNNLISNKYVSVPYSGVYGSYISEQKPAISIYKNGLILFDPDCVREANYLSANALRESLKANPLTIVFKLSTPVYEKIDADLSVNLFEGTTHVSNNSNIPANMEITVDRVLNRATEAIELAKTNPTVENLSRARMWVNLVSESVKKDELQSEINNITDINDLQLERKSATANMDVYVKSENMLSMSLNTNSVTFDNYSGVEDMEMLSAVNISINSSLPYDLNAYMPSEIANSDKSNIIDMDILNIKESNESVYQRFANTTDKIILKDGCNAGNNLIHNIDLKLASNQAHKADVYKTVIKFEAEQK